MVTEVPNILRSFKASVTIYQSLRRNVSGKQLLCPCRTSYNISPSILAARLEWRITDLE